MKSACRDDQEMIVTLRTKGMWTMRSVAGSVAADARVSPKAPVRQLVAKADAAFGQMSGLATQAPAARRTLRLWQGACFWPW